MRPHGLGAPARRTGRPRVELLAYVGPSMETGAGRAGPEGSRCRFTCTLHPPYVVRWYTPQTSRPSERERASARRRRRRSPSLPQARYGPHFRMSSAGSSTRGAATQVSPLAAPGGRRQLHHLSSGVHLQHFTACPPRPRGKVGREWCCAGLLPSAACSARVGTWPPKLEPGVLFQNRLAAIQMQGEAPPRVCHRRWQPILFRAANVSHPTATGEQGELGQHHALALGRMVSTGGANMKRYPQYPRVHVATSASRIRTPLAQGRGMGCQRRYSSGMIAGYRSLPAMSCIARTSSQVHRFASLSRFTLLSLLISVVFTCALPLPALSPAAQRHLCTQPHIYLH